MTRRPAQTALTLVEMLTSLAVLSVLPVRRKKGLLALAVDSAGLAT